MDPQLLERLRQITPEEQRILEGDQNVDRKLYTSARNFVIDSRKLLARGKLIEVHPHTRFIHFPRHSHNYVEMVYMCSGTTTHIINGTKKLVLAQGDLLLLNLTSFADTIDREGEGQYEQHLVFLALQYLDNHYRTGTLEDFSASVHMQPYTVSRLLKKHTSMNFKELLMERRLRQAAYLLSNTSFSTEAVLHAIGYENSSFFYRKFKEKYGKTPKAFRRISEKE